MDEAFVAAHATGWEMLRRGCSGRTGATRRGRRRRSGPRGCAARRRRASSRWRATGRAAARPHSSPASRSSARGAGRRPCAWRSPCRSRPATSGASAARRAGAPGAACPGRASRASPCRRTPSAASIAENDWADAVLDGPAGGHPSTSAPPSTWAATTSRRPPTSARASAPCRRSSSPSATTCSSPPRRSTATSSCPSPTGSSATTSCSRAPTTCSTPTRWRAPGAGARRLRDLRRPRRAHGHRDDFTAGKDEDAWLGSSSSAPRSRTRTSSAPPASTSRPSQERVGLAAFAEDPAVPAGDASGKVELAGAACVAAGLSEVPEARVRRADDARPLRLVTPEVALPRALAARRHPVVPRARRPSPVDEPGGRRGARRRRRRRRAGLERSGRVRCACRVTDDVMPGVVSFARASSRTSVPTASTRPAPPTSSPRTSRRCRAAARRCTRRSSRCG